MFGYRVREEPFKIKWAVEDVEVKIRNIRDPASRRRTRATFDYLMSASNCSYAKFIQMHWSHVREPWIFELFSHPPFHDVETALWAHLYHDNTLCESFLEGQEIDSASNGFKQPAIELVLQDIVMEGEVGDGREDFMLERDFTTCPIFLTFQDTFAHVRGVIHTGP